MTDWTTKDELSLLKKNGGFSATAITDNYYCMHYEGIYHENGTVLYIQREDE
jgi:hypothetical protein